MNASTIFCETRCTELCDRAACKGLMNPNSRSRVKLVCGVGAGVGDVEGGGDAEVAGGLDDGAGTGREDDGLGGSSLNVQTLRSLVNMGVSSEATAYRGVSVRGIRHSQMKNARTSTRSLGVKYTSLTYFCSMPMNPTVNSILNGVFDPASSGGRDSIFEPVQNGTKR